MSQEQKRYLSYLIRLWRENGEDSSWRPLAVTKKSDAPIWRASLERPGTHVRVGFASLDDLFAFLQQETGTARDGAKEENDAGNDGQWLNDDPLHQHTAFRRHLSRDNATAPGLLQSR
jgi:hypothetical protein